MKNHYSKIVSKKIAVTPDYASFERLKVLGQKKMSVQFHNM